MRPAGQFGANARRTSPRTETLAGRGMANGGATEMRTRVQKPSLALDGAGGPHSFPTSRLQQTARVARKRLPRRGFAGGQRFFSDEPSATNGARGAETSPKARFCRGATFFSDEPSATSGKRGAETFPKGRTRRGVPPVLERADQNATAQVMAIKIRQPAKMTRSQPFAFRACFMLRVLRHDE